MSSSDRNTPNYAHRRSIDKSVSRDKADSAPRVRFENNTLSINHPSPVLGQQLLEEALGADWDFVLGLLHQMARTSPGFLGPPETQINFMISVVKSIKPQDQVEAMIAAQMATIHACVMTLAARLMHTQNPRQQDSNERALNKLTRTFNDQLGALARYRSLRLSQAMLTGQSSNNSGVVPMSDTTAISDNSGAILQAPVSVGDEQVQAAEPDTIKADGRQQIVSIKRTSLK